MVTEEIPSSSLLHYQVIELNSQAKWVIFVHGAGGSIKTWDQQIKDFGKRFNLLLIDLRDHGQSKNIQPEETHYSFELISKDIMGVINHLKIMKAHFVTLSFGSVIIQDFTLRYPNIVDKIVIVGGIFKGSLSIRMFVAIARVMNHLISYQAMYRLFSYLLMPRKRHQVARRIYQMQARKLTSGEYLKWVGLYGEFFRLLKRFFRQILEKPTLVVMGLDDYVFLRGSKQFLKHQKQVRMISMPGVGHICNIEQPDAFNHMALDFLRDHGSSG